MELFLRIILHSKDAKMSYVAVAFKQKRVISIVIAEEQKIFNLFTYFWNPTYNVMDVDGVVVRYMDYLKEDEKLNEKVKNNPLIRQFQPKMIYTNTHDGSFTEMK